MKKFLVLGFVIFVGDIIGFRSFWLSYLGDRVLVILAPVTWPWAQLQGDVFHLSFYWKLG